jgi:hypothetical protein
MVLLIVFIAIVCFLAGVFSGGIFFEYLSKSELRKRLEGEDSFKLSKFSESRRETRKRVNIQAQVLAPVLDSAGILMESEQITCMVKIIDISRHGIGIISDRFFKKGLVLKISCRSETLQLTDKEAQARNFSVSPKGIRTGLEFLVPLKDI